MTKRPWSLGCLLAWSMALVSLQLGAAFAETPAPQLERIPEPGTVPVAKRDFTAMSVDDITACMRANIVDRGSLRDIEMRSTDREGKTRTLRMKLFWKPERDVTTMRTTLRVVEPTLYAGSAYLILTKPEGDEVYLYMSTNSRVQRVSGDQDGSLLGTDFTHSDVKHVQALLEKGAVKRMPDAKVADRAVFVLDTATDVSTTGYTRIVSYVDQATCTLLKSEFFTQDNGPQKILDADLSSLLQADKWWLMLGYTMRDLRSETRTELRLSDIYLLERLPEGLFDPETFYRVVL
jgi:hypothetical protein